MARTVTTPIRMVSADYQCLHIYVRGGDITANPFFTFRPEKPGNIVLLEFAATVGMVGGPATITPAINGTNVQGVDLTLTAAALGTPGDLVSTGNATGLQNFVIGDLITLVGSNVSVFSGGAGYFLMGVEYGTHAG